MIRTYGGKPYRAVVIHGGPGATGSVACIARELSKRCGVIEPIQTRHSVTELIEELHEQIESVTKKPLTLIGHSWGAWLAVLYAAGFPELVQQLVLVGCGPFVEHYVPQILERRLTRLSPQEAEQFRKLLAVLDQSDTSKKDDAMNRLAVLVEKTDNVDPLTMETDELDLLPVDGKMYASVWPQAAEMRRDGRLVEALRRLACPVHVLHGDDDPHPVEGVVEPLRKCHVDFSCHVLKDCGHSPFRERNAHEEFYRMIEMIFHNNQISYT